MPTLAPAGRARLVFVALAVCALAVPASASAAAPPRAPAGLAFYSPPKRLLSGPHGSVIWARAIRSPLTSAGRAYLVLYRSTGVDGKPVGVSGTVEVPKGRAPRAGWPVVSWAHGTTGIADACAPSRSPSSASNSYAFSEFNAWLKRGYALARTDYEGLGTPGIHPYLIGRSEGRGVVDIVRAARLLNPGVGRRWIIAGHSQGGHAALFAAALGPSWAPELTLRGVAAFAPASHVGTQARAIGALTAPSPISGLAALILEGAATADPAIKPAQLFSDRAVALRPLIQRECIGALISATEFGALGPAQLVRPGADLSRLLRVLDAQNPALRIRVPVLILQGLADTTVFPVFTNQLTQELRAKGDALSYRTYPGVSHVTVLANGASGATSFFAARLR
jgi:pimeloyl-ACP methyl ester carboxylesterase